MDDPLGKPEGDADDFGDDGDISARVAQTYSFTDPETELDLKLSTRFAGFVNDAVKNIIERESRLFLLRFFHDYDAKCLTAESRFDK